MAPAIITYDQANKYTTEERAGFHKQHNIMIDDFTERIIIQSKEEGNGYRRD